MRRFELTDDQWAVVAPLLPRQGRGGRWNDHRTMLDGMLWVLRTGSPWRDMPERYGKWQSVYSRFRRWSRDGTFDRILRALRLRLDREGRIDWDLWCVDGTNVRASKAAAGASKKTGRTSRRTTRWAAREAGGGPSSIWSFVVGELPSAPSSARARNTSRGTSSD